MKPLNKLYAILQLWRPPLLILGFIASLGLLKWSRNLVDVIKSALIVTTIGFANLGFNTFNELKDVEIDKVNKPWKPLPSGKVSRKFALYSSFVSIVISVITLAFLVMFFDIFYLIAIIGYFTAYVYNEMQKRDLLGNVCLGATYTIAGLISTYPQILQMVFALIFGLFTIAFNIFVQWQDIPADKRRGVITAPIQLGNKAIIISEVLSIINVLVTIKLFCLTGKMFLLLFILTNLLVVISVFGVTKKNREFIEWTIRRGGRFLIILMFFWMIFSE